MKNMLCEVKSILLRISVFGYACAVCTFQHLALCHRVMLMLLDLTSKLRRARSLPLAHVVAKVACTFDIRYTMDLSYLGRLAI